MLCHHTYACTCCYVSDSVSPVPTTKLVLVVGIALLDTGSGGGSAGPRVLLAQRPAGKANAGLWEFPGGKVDAGETPEAALVREIREELGAVVEASDCVPLTFVSWPYPTFHLLMPLYACTRWQGVPRGLEGQAVAWATREELEAGAAAAAGAGGGGSSVSSSSDSAPSSQSALSGSSGASNTTASTSYPLCPADVPLVAAVLRQMDALTARQAY